MRLRSLRFLAFATVTVPLLWFLYLFHSVFVMPEDPPWVYKNIRRLPDTMKRESNIDLAVQHARTRTPLKKSVDTLDGENEAHQQARFKIEEVAGTVFTGEKKRKSPKKEEDIFEMDMKGEVPGQDQVLDGDEGASEYARDNVLQVPDENGDEVTYPSFVETLPSDAEGNGPNGLKIDKRLLSGKQMKVYKQLWERNQFNQYASDRIPVRRELPDFRSQECQEMQYPKHLPTMSVVMIFHNEAWSVLLRSVHSVLSRTPPHLLLQVILVDDFSTMDHLKKPLDKYFRNYPKVKILRAPKRGGLTKARLLGFEATTGEVVVFLDSHIECTEGWAEPLLWMISENYRTVPFPMIDMITTEELRYVNDNNSPLGVFSLSTMTFRWTHALKRPRVPQTQPKQSPTMPGGLFAISRKWFEELGKYDPELDYWGGENIELSFKAWMCGGSVVIADCSHVGHIFRAKNPIKWYQGGLGNRNYVRVAMVWMDDYKNYYLEPSLYRLGSYGDISDRLAIRKRLKCHSFQWYVNNVYPELVEQVVFNATYAGTIIHEESGMCLDKMGNNPRGPGLFGCHNLGGSQFWYFSDDKYIQMENKFLCKSETDSVRLCSRDRRQRWVYHPVSRHIVHVQSGKCLHKNRKEDSLVGLKLKPCRENYTSQRWKMEHRRKMRFRGNPGGF